VFARATKPGEPAPGLGLEPPPGELPRLAPV